MSDLPALDGDAVRAAREVHFPPPEHEVTAYFEPADPWQYVAPTTHEELAAEYAASCARHGTEPIPAVLDQIKELPAEVVRAERGCGVRAPRLCLSGWPLRGPAAADALEAVLRRVQFRRVDVDDTQMDDETAEAMFDMLEYYESANTLNISGNKQFGIHGWQACSRMIKKSMELAELEARDTGLSETHAPVLCRALRLTTCRLRALRLQSAKLAGQPLLILVSALKSNSSVRELQLGDNGLSPKDAAQLGQLLRSNSTLQLLDLSNNQIQDAGMAHIAEALAHQATASPMSPLHTSGGSAAAACGNAAPERGLAVLVLWNNQLTRNSAPHLAKALRSSSSLMVLNVGRNGVGCEGVRALRSSRLLSLGLQAARLGPDAAGPIVDLLQGTVLQRLDLRENRLGVASLRALAAAMRNNRTLSQIDLDDPPAHDTLSPASAASGADEESELARLTREVRALCRRNEVSGADSEPRARLVHRKISLTCHTSLLSQDSPPEEERRGSGGGGGRLRSPAPSPAPSPAGSPVPSPGRPRTGRFSVSRVTPERDDSRGSSTDSSSPSTPPARGAFFSTTPQSRFRVVQVAETPQICVQSDPVETPRRSSRFSVTRNYDTSYTPTQSPTPTSDALTSSDSCLSMFEAVQKTSKCSQSTPKRVHSAPNVIQLAENFQTSTIIDSPLSEVDRAKLDNVLTSTENDNLKSVHYILEQRENDCTTSVQSTSVEAIIDVSSTTRSLCDTTNAKFIKTNKTQSTNVVNTPTEHLKTVSDLIECKKHATKSGHNNTCVTDKLTPLTDENDTLQVIEVKVRPIDSNATNDQNNLTVSNDANDDKNNDEDDSREDVKVNLGGVYDKASKFVQHTEIDNKTAETGNTELGKQLDTQKVRKDPMKEIEALTKDLGVLIDEMTTKVMTRKQEIKSECTQTDVQLDSIKDNAADTSVPASLGHNVRLKKNRSESSLDSPDLEVSRLMNKREKIIYDSSSSLEISGSSVESLNASEDTAPTTNPARVKVVEKNVEVTVDTELDRRKPEALQLSTESSLDSNNSELASETKNVLNSSVSSNESVSPIAFSRNKKIHGSLSSLEASVSSLDSSRGTMGRERAAAADMATSSDSGIEQSLYNPSDVKDDSNDCTLTGVSIIKHGSNNEKLQNNLQETLTSSPKRVSSLLDVSSVKSRGLDRARKISWVPPSASFHIPIPEPELKAEPKTSSNLDKLLSLFQNPSSIFSRSTSQNDETKVEFSNLSKKESAIGSSFWSWGLAIGSEIKEPEKPLTIDEPMSFIDEGDSSPENCSDSTLSMDRAQVESFSKRLDSKTPSTETDNTLSEFQPLPVCLSDSDVSQLEINTEKAEEQNNELKDIARTVSTDNIVQNVDLSEARETAVTCDILNVDLINEHPNDLRKEADFCYNDKAQIELQKPLKEFDNPPVVHEIISPEIKIENPQLEINLRNLKEDVRIEPVMRPRTFAAILKQTTGSENSLGRQSTPEGQSVENLPTKVIRGIKENISPDNTLTSSMTNTKALAEKLAERQRAHPQIVNALWEVTPPIFDKPECVENEKPDISEPIDVAKDALSFLVYGNQDFEPDAESSLGSKSGEEESFRQGTALDVELRNAELKEQVDLSPELIIDTSIPDVFPVTEKVFKKANSLEELIQTIEKVDKTEPIRTKSIKNIAFQLPETSGSIPKDIPEASGMYPRSCSHKSGSSPKSLPECLGIMNPLSKIEYKGKKKKSINSLGKMARDSLLALNISEEEISEFRHWHKITSMESLRSVESVSEEVNSHSGHSSTDSRCRTCVRTSQESLMSLDSISEDCRCSGDCRSCEEEPRAKAPH